MLEPVSDWLDDSVRLPDWVALDDMLSLLVTLWLEDGEELGVSNWVPVWLCEAEDV